MYSLQLADNWFIELNPGDIIISKWDNKVIINTITETNAPLLDEKSVEILSFSTKKHFSLRRDGPYYWWVEVGY